MYLFLAKRELYQLLSPPNCLNNFSTDTETRVSVKLLANIVSVCLFTKRETIIISVSKASLGVYLKIPQNICACTESNKCPWTDSLNLLSIYFSTVYRSLFILFLSGKFEVMLSKLFRVLIFRYTPSGIAALK